MKENCKDFLFNLLISLCIGMLVGMVQIVAANMNSNNRIILALSTILGGIIGTISRLVFIYTFEIKQKNVKLAFAAVFLTIFIIACAPYEYHYFIETINVSLKEVLVILISAEFLGMSFCYYSYKRCLNFNLKLTNKKFELSKR